MTVGARPRHAMPEHPRRESAGGFPQPTRLGILTLYHTGNAFYGTSPSAKMRRGAVLNRAAKLNRVFWLCRALILLQWDDQ
jgi:hypothetical protein